MHGFGKARLSQQDLPPDFVPALEAAWARGGTRANAQDCAQLLVSIARLKLVSSRLVARRARGLSVQT